MKAERFSLVAFFRVRAFKQAKPLVLIVFCYLVAALLVSRAYGWSGVCHRKLTALTVTLVGKMNSRSLYSHSSAHCHKSPHDSSVESLEALLRGSVAPDRRGHDGWLPPSSHGLTPFDVKGEKLRGKAHVSYKNIVNGICYIKGSDKEWWFQAGRALHIIQDLSQPFHTGSGQNETLYHALYEKRVEEHIEFVLNKVAEADFTGKGGEGFSSFATGNEAFLYLPFKSAALARSDFDELHRLCRQGEWSKSLETLTIRCLSRAVELGVRFIRRIEALRIDRNHSSYGKFLERCSVAGSVLCGIAFILWMHFFIYCRG